MNDASLRKIAIPVLMLAVLFYVSGPARAADACDAHPCLIMTPADVEILKKNIESVRWMKDYFEGVKTRVDGEIAAGVAVPAGGGEWALYYICPSSGAKLVYDPSKPREHYCPTDGRYYTGELLDGAWRWYTHIRNIESARDAGLLYRLTGDERYAAHARELLIRYAVSYGARAVHGGPAGMGRITGQSLDEAVWMIVAACAFDLIADAPCMSGRDREGIIRKLIIPGAKHVEGFPFGIHNIQVWEDVAMLTAGLLAGSSYYVDFATNDLEKQLREGISAEGLWYETSLGYHLYTAEPLMILAAVCRNRGLELCGAEKFRRFFTAPAELAMPGGMLPTINDARREYYLWHVASGAVVARYAFDDPTLDPLVAALGARVGRKWPSPFPFMYYRAPAADTPRWQPPSRSAHMPDSGLTVLRRDGAFALIKYNADCHGHDHNDRLELVYHDGARELFPDRGTVPYSHPLYRSWYKTTAAHSTLMVDGAEQTRDRCEPLFFYDEPDFTGVTVRCDTVYEGVTMRRTLALAGGALIDVFAAESESEHNYDWLLHANALFAPGAETAPAIGAPTPSDRIEFTARREMTEPVTITWPPLKPGEPESHTTLLYYTPWVESELFEGRATGFLADTELPVVVWRQRGARAVFCAVTSSALSDYTLRASADAITIALPEGAITIDNSGSISFK